ncbi:pre-mRNA-splicing factor CWC25 [Apodospora peruviana]|uniref:Pre-mRNA-splicing factor CWC25 n=1 Tax=Apodospora peruviana TaxID=516989 RepID=A0AAE0IT68_9PEZI|nr:pre-mRNA-splicing factor CWC25 [Apodospora peruviana]
MGSGDLNMKKSWHPQRSGNVAATQKAEAEAIAERKKLQLRLHEIEEERKKEEIQKALEAAGGKRKVDRVEWMYAGPTDGQGGDAHENEAYLLGKRRIDKLLQDNEVKKLQKQPSQDQIAEVNAIANARDVATKIREDPLLAIKRKEQQAYEAMMNDPIKRRQLLASMGIDDSRDKSRRKEERSHKHHHHHRSHRHRDDDRDGDRHSRRRRSDSRDRSRSPRRHDSDAEDRRRRRRDSPERRRYRSASEDERDYRIKREDGRSSRPYDRRSREKLRSTSPPPRMKRGYSRERDNSPRRDHRARRDYRGSGSRSGSRSDERSGHPPRPPRQEYEDDNRVRQNGRRPTNDASAAAEKDGEAEQERARKLAAMQEAATELDKDRERRLALIEEAERVAREADDRARQRNKKFGGDASFTNNLHSRAADMKVSARVGAR